jgi:hypothetical protein
VYAPVESGLLPEPRAWFVIAYDEAQYYWVIDLADQNPGNPLVYRADHEGNDRMPTREFLSRCLAEPTLATPDG